MSTDQAPDPQAPDAAPAAAVPGCGCWSRRQSLVVAGVALVGTAGLTACGSHAADAGGAAASAGGAIKAADIPVGGGKVFDSLKVVVTQPTAGDFKAFSAVCTHQGCTVAGVANGVITCPCHGSTFDIATGAVRQGPATTGLPAKTVSVGTDGITVT